ncbi:ATP-binding protein [Brucella sp. 2716]|uniref:ATP-binding protein n=1 Tax=Brucella sp. 2716 TaxID=2975052 RepID=UPI00217D1190|nr:ATP-binding protein [Brucella sp. 2716]UWF60796.1 ATP-binding protein [Brucella sp. 2716]
MTGLCTHYQTPSAILPVVVMETDDAARLKPPDGDRPQAERSISISHKQMPPHERCRP